MKKQKLKTHKGLQKRFRITKTGKVMRSTKKNRKYAYTHNKKLKNVDKKTMAIAKPEAKRIKKFIKK